MNNTCDKCKYWSPTAPEFGQCRKNPPLLVLGMIYKDAEDNEKDWAVWPETYQTDWCGSWQKIHKQPELYTDEQKFELIWKTLDTRSRRHLFRNNIKTITDLTTKVPDIKKNYGLSTEKNLLTVCENVLGFVPENLKIL